ncbi:hypothetical protein DDW13_04740 [Acidianus hospitalis]|uniref:Uncharacterized protein n=1 Tax=Acidianus hospitalis TaxID=563177 RepID=A0A2T9X6E0_9CREN|nr:hypothetical protein DDW13_04740 [Acidianus hospitalis]
MEINLKIFCTNYYVFLERLLDKKSLVISYYYSVNLTLLMNFASLYYRKTGKSICIGNFGKIKWEFYPKDVDFPIKCDENSAFLVFEAENENELPEKFIFATSYKNLKVNAIKVRVEKFEYNTYKAIIEDEIIPFKIVKGEINEIKLANDYTELLNIIKELGGECEMRDLVNIASKRLNIPRDEVKEKILFLKEIDKIDIEGKKIKLIL